MAKPGNDRNLTTTVSLNALFEACASDLSAFLIHPGDTCLLDSNIQFVDKRRYVSEQLTSTVSRVNFLRYSALRQLEALYKKNQDAPGSSSQGRKDKALSAFYASEMKCKRTNKRLSHYLNRPSRFPKGIREVFYLAQNISYDIFGPLTRETFQRVLVSSGFGPGQTYSSAGEDGHHLYYKMAGPHSFTEAALPYVKTLLNHSSLWKQALIEEGSVYDISRGNRVAFVPKDSATDRTIAIEPSLNVFLQKGVESVLKGRLRRTGVSLTNQEQNQSVAKIASSRPLYAATLDLSSASDSVSTELVRFMAPHLWFVLMDDLRSPEFTLDKGKTWQYYNKFSSMGNAFTFPLETILFYSFAKACTILSGGNLEVLRVYGDDILVDPRAALLLVEVLKFAGFSVNEEKSFVFGDFKETCGTDFLAGVDTRPVYLKNVPRNDQQVYNLFNRLMGNRVGFRFHNLCEYIHSTVKKPFYGPPDLGAGLNYSRWYAGKAVIFDHYFHAPPHVGDRFRRYDKQTQNQFWRIQLLRFRPKLIDTTNWSLQFHYLAFLYGLSGNDQVESLSRFRRTLPYESFIRWSEPPWRPAFYDCGPFAVNS